MDEPNPDVIEDLNFVCPRCGKAVVTKWVRCGGLLPSPEYDLIGDLIFHSNCWDELIAEHPPGDPDL